MDSSKLIKARQEKGWSQEELAEKAGVSLRTIQRIEAKEVRPRHSTLRLLADNLQVPFSEFMEEEKQTSATLVLSKAFEVAKIIALNLLVITVVNYLNFEVGANTNSRIGSWMMSVMLPFLLVFLTLNESYTERFYRYGWALLIDLFLVFLFVSEPFSIENSLPVSVLIVSCILYMPVLYYLGRAFEKYKKTWMPA